MMTKFTAINVERSRAQVPRFGFNFIRGNENKLRLRIDEPLDEPWARDSVHFHMLIVHNAIRYSSPRTQVTIGCSRNLRHAVIEVSDRGQGIAAEHRAKILDRFYRVDKASSRAKGGHGLGLAIAKWSVEHQGGRIEVQSEVGKGGTFRIVLPV